MMIYRTSLLSTRELNHTGGDFAKEYRKISLRFDHYVEISHSPASSHPVHVILFVSRHLARSFHRSGFGEIAEQ